MSNCKLCGEADQIICTPCLMLLKEYPLLDIKTVLLFKKSDYFYYALFTGYKVFFQVTIPTREFIALNEMETTKLREFIINYQLSHE